MNHTPLPWKVSEFDLPPGDYQISVIGAGRVICDMPSTKEVDDANAQFIVKACNNHYDLLNACKAQAEAENHKRICDECYTDYVCPVGQTLAETALELRKSAIAKAEG